MRLFTSIGFSKTSNPHTFAFPLVGGRTPVRMRIVVVFPAPFGPRNPRISPDWTWKLTSSTAFRSRYLFERCETSIMCCDSFGASCPSERRLYEQREGALSSTGHDL